MAKLKAVRSTNQQEGNDMATRNERRSGKPLKYDSTTTGPKVAKPTPASMKGVKNVKSNKRGKR